MPLLSRIGLGYLTNTKGYILGIKIVGKVSYMVKYRFIQFSILVKFNQYLASTNQCILKTNILG